MAVGAAAHALAWAAIIPPGQGPDEEEHFAYVQFLVEERRLPTYARDFYVSAEWDAALRAAGFDRIRWNRAERARPFEWPPADPPAAREASDRRPVSSAAAQPPLYYLLAAPAYIALRETSPITRLYAIRAVGALLAAATALAAHRALAAALGDGPRARLGAVLAAAWPQGAFLNGVASPDGLCTLTASAALAAALGGSALGAGLLGGLAGLAKPFGISAAVAVVLVARRRLPAAIGAAIPLLPWFALNLARYGGLSGHAVHAPTGDEAFLDLFRVTSPWTLFSQAWGVFGWLDTPLPKAVRLALAVVCLWAAVRARGVRPLWTFAAVHVALVVGAVWWTYRTTGYLVALQGRYFLHPLAAWTGLLAAGLPGAPRTSSAAAVGLAVLSLVVAWLRYHGP